MAAGLGYKEFNTGDVLTAADANGYLASQVVMVFANASARTSAIASPQEGMVSYLKDTNATEYYTGSAWTSIAGASGGMTLLSTTTLSGTSTVISIAPSGYNNLQIVVSGMTTSANNDYPRMDLNSTSASVYMTGTQTGNVTTSTELYFNGANELKKDGGLNVWVVNVFNVNSSSYYKSLTSTSYGQQFNSANQARHEGGAFLSTNAISGVRIQTISGNSFTGGQVLIYGVK